MQDSVRTQLCPAINTAETMPFCIFFFLNLELRENKKNLKEEEEEEEGEEENIKGERRSEEQRSEEHPNP